MKTVAALCAIGALAAAGLHLSAVALGAEAGAQTTPSAGRFIVIGCISAPSTGTAAAPGPSAFIITDSRGEKPAIYRLDGDAGKLKIHVGHTVEVSGSLSPGSSTSRDPIAGAPVMKVEKLTWISTSCRTTKKN